MITPAQRIAERKARNNFERLINKNQTSPSVIEVIASDGIAYAVPIAKEFAPILQFAEESKLLEFAVNYDLPISKQDVFLLSEGDTYLDQYEKIDLSEEEQVELLNDMWQPLVSSNIKAVKQDGKDLLLWFHSGSKYRYPDQAEMYTVFAEALSPGRLLWRTIRFARGYSKL